MVTSQADETSLEAVLSRLPAGGAVTVRRDRLDSSAMPHSARSAGKGRGYNIVNKRTGKVVGHSTSKRKAQSSARARDAAAHGWKPSKRSK